MDKTFKIVGNDISDGYHTFDELYDHRNLLFIALLKSGAPEGGSYYVREHYDGWDLLVTYINANEQISYHVPSKYRCLYSGWLKEENVEHVFDGHTPSDVLSRLTRFCSDKGASWG